MENPYAPPSVNDLQRRRSGFDALGALTVLAVLLLGATVTTIALFLIYVNDPRTGANGPSLRFVLVSGTVLSGSVWAITGWLQRRRFVGVFSCFGFAGGCALLWVAIGGTYADVLGAAACVAWPFGGLICSIGISLYTRQRRLRTQVNTANG